MPRSMISGMVPTVAFFAFILGLTLFLGVHSVRIAADPWRERMRARFGANAWRGAYSLVSLVGFGLIVWGYGTARWSSPHLWLAPVWTRHVAGLLTLPSFVLIAAAYVPKTHLKATIGHPMLAGVKLWALAHLISNGRVADVILFGSFLVWAVFDFRACRRRDRAAGVRYEAGPVSGDVVCLLVGIASWAIFTFALHFRLIGLAPFGWSL